MCGSYCLNVLNPLLDRIKELQNPVEAGNENDKLNILKTLENFESRLKNIEINTQNQSSNSLLKFDSIEDKLEEVRRKVVTKTATVGKFERIGHKYYYIEHREKVNWFVAGDICRTMGGHLVSFKNWREFSKVRDQLQGNNDYWIDLNDLGTEGQFRSVDTGFMPEFTYWHWGEPNNGKDEDCVDLWYKDSKHYMNDANCMVLKSFICESSNL